MYIKCYGIVKMETNASTGGLAEIMAFRVVREEWVIV
jgi:hypothetical protein